MSLSPNIGGVSGSGRRDLSTLFSRGQRTTTVDEAASLLGLSRPEAARRLAAWASNGWLRRVRRGLYLLVPVDAPDPSTWSEDPWYLADLVWHPCYVTGWTAANHWGLTDQVFRSTVVATNVRVRRIDQELAGNPYLVHHVPPEYLAWGMRSEWRHERRVLVADPARTVAELLGAPSLGGGIRHVMEVLDEYLRDAEPSALVESLDRFGNGAAFKRLGYLLEQLGLDDPVLVAYLAPRLTAGTSSLDPSLPAVGPRSARWGLRVNADVAA